jgi:hypothetical protein
MVLSSNFVAICETAASDLNADQLTTTCSVAPTGIPIQGSLDMSTEKSKKVAETIPNRKSTEPQVLVITMWISVGLLILVLAIERQFIWMFVVLAVCSFVLHSFDVPSLTEAIPLEKINVTEITELMSLKKMNFQEISEAMPLENVKAKIISHYDALQKSAQRSPRLTAFLLTILGAPVVIIQFMLIVWCLG